MARYRTLRDSLQNVATGAWSRVGGKRGAAGRVEGRSLWALRDVSFELNDGEALGIIGHNGAGKTTLLKILSRITSPTTGSAEVRGRVGTLLEVGTGFHPELTGRDNVYMSGALLGMSRSYVRRHLDEIVAFAGVERFLDTPVKRYSSGMQVRLGFAVAVHLEPEILVVDEVLAVGDAEFQKKCVERLRRIGGSGRTILFVSHNLAAVRSVCTAGMILDAGRIAAWGAIDEVCDRYLSQATRPVEGFTAETDAFVVEQVRLGSRNNSVIKTFDPLEIRVRLRAKTTIVDPGLYVGIQTREGHYVAGLDFRDYRSAGRMAPGDVAELGFDIDSIPLLPGSYRVELVLKDLGPPRFESVPRLLELEIAETPVYGGRKLDHWYGSVGLRARATLERSDG